MIIEKMNRQQGKSTKIAELLQENKNSIVLVPNETSKKLFHKRFKINIKRILTVNDMLKQKKVGKKVDLVYMDDVGECMLMIFGRSIDLGMHSDY